MTPTELYADLRSRINPAYSNQRGTESYERRVCAEAIEGLVAEIAGWKADQKENLANQVQLAEQLAEKNQSLSNLLARIHRDGGHYEAKHGIEKALRDADLQVAFMFRQMLELEDHLELSHKVSANLMKENHSVEYPAVIGNIGTACGEYVECSGRPDAPHGVDVEASFRAGRTVCVCKSWAPGEAS